MRKPTIDILKTLHAAMSHMFTNSIHSGINGLTGTDIKTILSAHYLTPAKYHAGIVACGKMELIDKGIKRANDHSTYRWTGGAPTADDVMCAFKFVTNQTGYMLKSNGNIMKELRAHIAEFDGAANAWGKNFEAAAKRELPSGGRIEGIRVDELRDTTNNRVGEKLSPEQQRTFNKAFDESITSLSTALAELKQRVEKSKQERERTPHNPNTANIPVEMQLRIRVAVEIEPAPSTTSRQQPIRRDYALAE